jgi:uncharacterized protein YciI
MKTGITLIMVALASLAFAGNDAENTQSLFIVHFETGEHWDVSLGAHEQTGFKQHSANLQKLRHDGTIVFGARYADLGLIILRHDSLATAAELLNADPGVQSGIFVFRIEPVRIFYEWKD